MHDGVWGRIVLCMGLLRKCYLYHITDNHKKDYAAIDKFDSCSEYKSKKRHHSNLKGLPRGVMCDNFTKESTHKRANDKSPRWKHEESHQHAYHRTSCALFATATKIGKPYRSHIVEYGYYSKEDCSYPYRGTTNMGTFTQKQQQQSTKTHWRSWQHWQNRAC